MIWILRGSKAFMSIGFTTHSFGMWSWRPCLLSTFLSFAASTMSLKGSARLWLSLREAHVNYRQSEKKVLSSDDISWNQFTVWYIIVKSSFHKTFGQNTIHRSKIGSFESLFTLRGSNTLVSRKIPHLCSLKKKIVKSTI